MAESHFFDAQTETMYPSENCDVDVCRCIFLKVEKGVCITILDIENPDSVQLPMLVFVPENKQFANLGTISVLVDDLSGFSRGP